jgi:hypothetical protein
MADTRTTITVDGSPLSASDLFRVQSLHLEEALGGQDRASIAVAMVTDDRSGWKSPLDSLVAAAKPFTVSLERADGTHQLDARSVSASWSLVAGGLSTLTIEGMDRSVELDRRDVRQVWQNMTDSAIARTLFSRYQLAARVDETPTGTDSGVYSPQQNGTDWAFLKGLAGRNGFDVRVESIDGVPTGVFAKINPLASPQTTIELGYGALGGSAQASVQLLASQEVHVTRSIVGTTGSDVASDPGTGHAMAAVSLGGATLVHTNAAADMSVVDAQTTASAIAERSAFAASLNATLSAPDMPLVRARRTIAVRGLGEMLDGLWLVQSVRHEITQAGHTQAVSLIRNALGAGGGAPAASLAAAVGGSL